MAHTTKFLLVSVLVLVLVCVCSAQKPSRGNYVVKPMAEQIIYGSPRVERLTQSYSRPMLSSSHNTIRVPKKQQYAYAPVGATMLVSDEGVGGVGDTELVDGIIVSKSATLPPLDPNPTRPPTLQRRSGRDYFVASATNAQGQHRRTGDLQAAAGHHHGQHGHGGYHQYQRVPEEGAWEFGYKRGNPYHFIERHEKGLLNQFKTKVKWGDKHGGYGEHYWDYNHTEAPPTTEKPWDKYGKWKGYDDKGYKAAK